MSSTFQQKLEERVIRAAEAALAHNNYVSAVDVLVGIGFLAPAHVQDWRHGRLSCLQQAIQASAGKVEHALKVFRDWAARRGLRPSQTAYLTQTRGEQRELQFSLSGDPEIELVYRTHYVSPELSDRKKQGIQTKLGKAPELVVFDTLRDSECAQCKTPLERGSFLFLEKGQALCLECADMGHLTYLPSGDAALTRRAKEHSRLWAVVVRFSRARKRYERQGILVEEAALRQAEEECFSDADARARRRARQALRTEQEEKAFVEQLAGRIRVLYPGCPEEEARRISEHTALRGSGRVGRSTAGRALEEEAVRLAVVAAVRHIHTNYEELLMQGLDRSRARQEVADEIEQVLEAWASV